MTTKAIQKYDPVIAELATNLDFTPDYVQTVKDAFAKGTTDLELKMFLQTAKRTGLDPFARQIYCIKRWDGKLKREVAQTQVSIDGFRLIAERSGNYVPGRETTYTFDADGRIESATAYIKKCVGDVWHEIAATAFYEEYVQRTKEGHPNSMWSRMPRVMLGKCAEALALRKAFPAQLSGLYTVDEMGQAEASHYDVTVEPIQSAEPVHEPQQSETAPESDTLTDLKVQIAALCKELNAANDEQKWTAGVLREYLTNSLGRSDARIENITEEEAKGIVDELGERLAIISE
ncbi:MAG: phage recombination protein Bet [Acidobacteria bacterium]|nr:phage recombination protein Bet [Acidobacteriota bacterium]